MKKGKVALVGAGPGDKGLLTLRALEILKKAEAVIYDRLVSDEVMELANPEAEFINVGKKSCHHSIPQSEINKLIVDSANKGKYTVRLKGGDPFIFGRIGEELEALIENGIEYEVVPGVTSAIAAPAYAGIPVTHRDHASSLHILTGHAKENNKLDIDFDSLTKLGGTIVFLMGVSNLEAIADGFKKAGMNKKTPAAIIENGTRKNQRKVIGNLENIYDKSLSAGIKSPAVVVIGEVCALSDKFDLMRVL